MVKINRALVIVLMLLMTVFVFAACGSQSGSDTGSDSSVTAETASVDSLKTMGEAFALNTEDDQWAVGNGKVV